MRKWILITAVASALMLSPRSAEAWHAGGHMAVAAMAHKLLSPEDRGRIFQTLKLHPQYDAWMAERPPDADSTELVQLYFFMRASIWPDEIKQDAAQAQYNRFADGPNVGKPKNSLHYINRVFVKPADVAAFNGLPDPKPANLPSPQGVDIEGALKDCLAACAKPDSKEKAIQLCWLFHLMGDLHQPLHCAEFYCQELPKGDEGGNLFLIAASKRTAHLPAHPSRFQIQGLPNLHSFWDSLLGEDDIPRAAAERPAAWSKALHHAQTRAGVLMAANPGQYLTILDAVTNQGAPFTAWSTESLEAARASAYLNGELKFGIRKNTNEAQDIEIPGFPEGYALKSRAVAEQRGALAGYRLAAILKAKVQ